MTDVGHPVGGPRILVVKLADLGDALLSTPSLAWLRDEQPAARVEALTRTAGAAGLSRSGLVDEVHVWRGGLAERLALLRRLRAARFDAILYLHSLVTSAGAVKHAALATAIGAPVRVGLRPPASWRAAFLTHAAQDLGYGGWHVVESFEAVVGAYLRAALGREPARLPDRSRHLRFLHDPAAWEAAGRLHGALPQRAGWLAMHPGGGAYSLARRWAPERFAELADALAGRGWGIVLLGQPGDGGEAVRRAARTELVDLTGRTDLPTLAALLARLGGLVTGDNGVMHLAAAVGAPVTALFGPTSPRAWGPWWPGVDGRGEPGPSPHRVVELADLPCRPCLYRGHALGDPAGCATRDCLAWLPVARVLAACGYP